MKTDEPIKSNRSFPADRPNPNFEFPRSSEVSRMFSCFSWNSGPITNGRGQQQKFFWERLQSDAPKDAAVYCCLINTVVFYRDKSYSEELCREESYGFSGVSPTLLACVEDGRVMFYQVACGTVIWREGRWWMRWSAYKNTRFARMLNHGWPHQ